MNSKIENFIYKNQVSFDLARKLKSIYNNQLIYELDSESLSRNIKLEVYSIMFSKILDLTDASFNHQILIIEELNILSRFYNQLFSDGDYIIFKEIKLHQMLIITLDGHNFKFKQN